MSMIIQVSSAADLERVMADLSSEGPSAVEFSVPRLDDLFEAGPLLRRLQQTCASRRDWDVNEGSVAALLEASEYYEKLDLLELRLGVLRLEVLDMEDGIAVRNLRREIVAEEHPISITSKLLDTKLLDTITVEVQEVERIATALGFTGSLAVDDSATTEDDIRRFFADGVSTGRVGVHGDDRVDAGPERMAVMDCVVDLGDSKGEAFRVGNSRTPLDDSKVKKKMKAVLGRIECLCQVLYKTKRGQFSLRSMN